MKITDKILESSKFVMNNTKDVKINYEKLKEFANKVKKEKNKKTNWIYQAPINLETLSEQEYIGLFWTFNMLSFSYWGNQHWNVTYKGKTQTRSSYNLIFTFERARDEGINIFKPKVQAIISEKEMRHVLRANTELSLIDKRTEILNEIGTEIINNYSGSFLKFIQEANYDGEFLLEKIINKFPSFDDTTKYKGKKIYFYKRAQALVQSLRVPFKKYQGLINCENLTALADYKMPPLYRDLRIFEYSKGLAKKIDNKELLKRRGELVTSIRAALVQSIHYGAKIADLTDAEFNDYSWLLAKEASSEFHRDRTWDY